jgi:hypothetical protein
VTTKRESFVEVLIIHSQGWSVLNALGVGFIVPPEVWPENAGLAKVIFDETPVGGRMPEGSSFAGSAVIFQPSPMTFPEPGVTMVLPFTDDGIDSTVGRAFKYVDGVWVQHQFDPAFIDPVKGLAYVKTLSFSTYVMMTVGAPPTTSTTVVMSTPTPSIVTTISTTVGMSTPTPSIVTTTSTIAIAVSVSLSIIICGCVISYMYYNSKQKKVNNATTPEIKKNMFNGIQLNIPPTVEHQPPTVEHQPKSLLAQKKNMFNGIQLNIPPTVEHQPNSRLVKRKNMFNGIQLDILPTAKHQTMEYATV